ncbi:hypothetical protein LCGC14_1252760 [marine sediment metagenome]|uniref:Uncharacterized protein n=1 Tax=marine sediment metagenome TaxID=412755 RepID=A0A0F9P6H2_9ZZZZ
MALKEAITNVDRAIKNADEIAKKLTTKDRKKLSKGTFCGPNRSFPVNDCQHASTAKAFLKRSKFSSATKKRIAACINRRAKSMGCKPGKKAKADIEMALALAETDIFKTTRELVNQSIEAEGLELDFNDCKGC